MSEEDGLKIWEPWHPHVGDRVRVNISPECEYHGRSIYPEYHQAAQGQSGTVVGWGKHAWKAPIFEHTFPGHRYPVQVDRPFNDGRDKIILAAAELEPID